MTPPKVSPERPRQRLGPRLRGNLPALGLMVVAVGLQVLGAVLLKTIADRRDAWTALALLAGVGAILFLNLARLVIWGRAHNRYPLSTTFPLSSLFFPAMLGVAALYGDPIGSLQVVGALLITSGVGWLTVRAPS